ncbi:hypothetical protein KYB31_18310 [Clostridium felsineum]|uniref:hypothetical protein n=1 Tax=Clostridium felsineum TaxID=36839 RepID=UPI00214D4E1E|nr:hypothetical protein [Clostridium felsineum]MCR3760930.1 hypothetical protein [Clostridium felsineum]
MKLYIFKRINKFDYNIVCFIKRHVKNKYLDVAMLIITTMGNLGTIWLGMAAIMIFLGNNYRLLGCEVIIYN